jgi:hypothetical protein
MSGDDANGSTTSSNPVPTLPTIIQVKSTPPLIIFKSLRYWVIAINDTNKFVNDVSVLLCQTFQKYVVINMLLFMFWLYKSDVYLLSILTMFI